MTLEVRKEHSKTNWLWLCKLILSRAIVFNKRRGGEASRMLVSDYENMGNWKERNTEKFRESLSPLELQMCERLSIVEIIGKRCHEVPILSAKVKQGLEILLTQRNAVEIEPANPYLFGRTQQFSQEYQRERYSPRSGIESRT